MVTPLLDPSASSARVLPRPAKRRSEFWLFVGVFVAGALLRSWDVGRPVDRADWRECDVSAIARNFCREGMNPLYPRIDWRGDGPGYAEMELPLLPWTMAVFYKVFGLHEPIGRVLCLAAGLLALLVFMRMARDLLDPRAALAACLFFAFSPLAVRQATALQPDGWMFAIGLLGVHRFLRWLRTDSWSDYCLSMVATSLAILAKAPAAYVGLLFASLLLWQRGLVALRDWRTWLFALVALLPGVAWYLHARQLYEVYGNSLGLSNEQHWADWECLTRPAYLKGLLRLQLTDVWMPAGMIVALAGAAFQRRQPAVTVSILWLMAIGIYLLAAIRTTSADWAYYYHVVSVPPVALLFGLGVSMLWSQATAVRQRRGLRAAGPAVAFALILVLGFVTYVQELLWIRQFMRTNDGPSAYCVSARELSTFMVPRELVVASGGPSQVNGHQAAYNASYFFYWLDVTGFNIASDRQSIEQLEEFRQHGARYFIAEKEKLKLADGFERELRRTYPLLGETDTVLLFELRPRKDTSPPRDREAPT